MAGYGVCMFASGYLAASATLQTATMPWAITAGASLAFAIVAGWIRVKRISGAAGSSCQTSRHGV